MADHLKIEELPAEETDVDLNPDLTEFKSEQEKRHAAMGEIFSAGDLEKQKKEKFDRLAKDLGEFKDRKAKNPFGDDAE